MKELHIQHHFVPKSYLKNWQDSENKICFYRTIVEHNNVPLWAKKSVAAVAYWSHLYTRSVSGYENDEVELWFDKEFESPAEPVIQKVIANRRLSREDWVVLIRFLALQDVRTPIRLFEHMHRLRTTLPETLNDVMQDLKENIEQEKFPILNKSTHTSNSSDYFPFRFTTELKPGAECGTLKIESYIGRATWLFSLKHLLGTTANVLQKYNWTIVAPAKGYSWFTSDNPVVRLNFYGNGQYDLRGGWGNLNGNIFFPLGPQHAMFVQIGQRSFTKGTKLDEFLTESLLKFTAENSHRMIFSNSFNNDIPILKPRLVDSDRVKREYQERKRWHEENMRLENEFERKNIN